MPLADLSAAVTVLTHDGNEASRQLERMHVPRRLAHTGPRPRHGLSLRRAPGWGRGWQGTAESCSPPPRSWGLSRFSPLSGDERTRIPRNSAPAAAHLLLPRVFLYLVYSVR